MVCKYTTMGDLRGFYGWIDDLDVNDGAKIVVESTGRVTMFTTGKVVRRKGFCGYEKLRKRWLKYFGFENE